MDGDNRVRFCRECQLQVYNLAAMSRGEAEALLREKAERRVCLQVYRRSNGTVITRDCPVGVRAARRKLAFLIGAAAAALLACFAYWECRETPPHQPRETLVWLRQWEPFRTVLEWLDPTPIDDSPGW